MVIPKAFVISLYFANKVGAHFSSGRFIRNSIYRWWLTCLDARHAKSPKYSFPQNIVHSCCNTLTILEIGLYCVQIISEGQLQCTSMIKDTLQLCARMIANHVNTFLTLSVMDSSVLQHYSSANWLHIPVVSMIR